MKKSNLDEKAIIENMNEVYFLQTKLVEYLAEGLTPDQAVRSLFKNCSKEKNYIIPETLAAMNSKEIQTAVEEAYNNLSKENRDLYHMINTTQRLFTLTDNEKLIYALNPEKELYEYTAEFLAKKGIKLNLKLTQVKRDYKPDRTERLYTGLQNQHFLNMYNPPLWLKPYYYSKQLNNVPKCAKVPDKIKRLIMYIVDNEEASYNYVINWLANVVQGRRNTTILMAFGQGGVGKGTLYEVMKFILDATNTYFGAQTTLDGDFNNGFAHKQLIYFNEISLNDAKTLDIVKSMTDQALNVQAKHKDRYVVDNTASIYISSNRVETIDPTALDRRFSIINVNTVRMDQLKEEQLAAGVALYPKEIKSLMEEAHLDHKCITDFAHYLYNKDLSDYNADHSFVSSYVYRLLRDSIQNSRWKQYFFKTYCEEKAGDSVLLSEVEQDIRKAAKDEGFTMHKNEFNIQMLKNLVSALNRLKMCELLETSQGFKVNFFDKKFYINLNDLAN